MRQTLHLEPGNFGTSDPTGNVLPSHSNNRANHRYLRKSNSDCWFTRAVVW